MISFSQVHTFESASSSVAVISLIVPGRECLYTKSDVNWCYYWIDGDYDRAVGEFEIAQRQSPSNADAARLKAAIKRRQGHWQEALDSYTHAQRSDPQNPNIVRELMYTHTAMRRWEGAAAWAQKMRAMAPASLVAKIQRRR